MAHCHGRGTSTQGTQSAHPKALTSRPRERDSDQVGQKLPYSSSHRRTACDGEEAMCVG